MKEEGGRRMKKIEIPEELFSFLELRAMETGFSKNQLLEALIRSYMNGDLDLVESKDKKLYFQQSSLFL